MIKQTMTSPFTGGIATLHNESSSLVFRKETFNFIHQFYECNDTHERFTTTEIDEINIAQVYNQYRAKYGIPFPEDIKRIRRHYALSATKMSEILGFGENQYRLYENGDMPSEANGKTLMSIMNPNVFLTYLENAREQFSDDEYAKLISKSKAWEKEKYPSCLVEHVFNNSRRTAFNGYATPSIDKLKNILLFFIEKQGGVFFTKMNKLLFYTDFHAYRMMGRGMTGLAYKAIDHGPVPLKWNRIYSFYNEIQQDIIRFSDGTEGIKLVSTLSPDRSIFSENELNILEYINNRFKQETSKQISETSHHEEAWLKNQNSDTLINYNLAFSLKAI